jgi:hypothetical protein
MFRRLSIVSFAVFLSIHLYSQELNCQVSILTPAIQASDKSIYDGLQTDLREFLNNKKWTEDDFTNQERIECSMVITISDRNDNNFKGDIQIQSRRPIYNSSYNSTILNHKDDDFTFKYVQGQVLDFDANNLNSNLTAVVAYYAYLIIGLDYDSFSPEGGNPYFLKAQTIVSNAQQLPDAGWRSFESKSDNRYWIIENLLNVSFKPLRNFSYVYHRQGFDKFYDNILDARLNITNNLNELRKVYQDKPNSAAMKLFFNAKVDEIVNLYSQATVDEKNTALQILTLVDPGNTLKYQTFASGR